MVKSLGIVVTLLIITTTTVFGQFKRQREYSGFFDTYYYRGPITFTAGAGMTTYRGDLTKTYTQGLSYAISVGANYKVWPHIVFGTEISYVNLQSVDGYPNRNISFVTSGFEFQAYGRLYLIDEIVRIAQDRKKESHYTFCKPYIQAGIGGYLYNAKAVINSPSTLNPDDPYLQVGAYSSLAFVIPAGFGLQFTISQRSSLCLEYIYRFAYTDNLDGVTTPLTNVKNDGYGIGMVKFQFAPTAPKGKKRKALPPPAQYDGPKGTETWKTKKQQENIRPQPQEEVIPENNTNTEEEEVLPEQETLPEQEQPATQEK